MKSKLKVLLASSLFALIMGCASTPTSESAGQFIDSSAVTTKVKAELTEKLGAKGAAITVETFKDNVQLSGFVNDFHTKRQAAMIASHVSGVKSVKNSLIVKRAVRRHR